MLATTALALSLAAPVPRAAPFPLRTDPLPDEYKPADLADAALPRSVKGTVSVLAWERIEDDRPHTVTTVLVLKAFDKADEKGRRYQLSELYRHPKHANWQYRFVDPPPPRPGEVVPRASDAFWHGSQGYANPPTDQELAAFLKDTDWTPELGAKPAITLKGKVVLTTKLTGGGVDRAAWKRHFDRDPPTDLFPELKVEEK